LSPEKAARRAARAAKDAKNARRENRRTVLIILGVAIASMGLMVADYFWQRHQARRRHEQRYHRDGQTNAPAVAAPMAGQNQVTNHE
jgi:hypothetical protein